MGFYKINMTTYQMESQKTGTKLSTVKIVSDKMGFKHTITTLQLKALEDALTEIAGQRDNIMYVFNMGREHAEERSLNEWLEIKTMEEAGRKL